MPGRTPDNENEVYAGVLCEHLRQMLRFLRRIPADQFDFTFNQAAPTPRLLAAHAWQWLICDRYHIEEPDASLHPYVPAPPTDPQALCDVLEEEMETWRTMLLAMTPEKLAEPRSQFNDTPTTVRGFVAHILQNTVYKSGQLATIYYGLGLDGTAPYEAPLPNPVYDEVFGPKA